MAPKVMVITDPRWSDEHIVATLERVARAAGPGELLIQLRDRARATRQVLALAHRLREVCSRLGALLVVNDRLDVAQAAFADGVHLGGGSVTVGDARRLLGGASFISVAAHSVDDVVRAEGEGADAALLSPIFETPGKGTPIGPDAIVEAKARARRLAVYALGGVTAANAIHCARAGADGVAVIRAVMAAQTPEDVIRSMVAAL